MSHDNLHLPCQVAFNDPIPIIEAFFFLHNHHLHCLLFQHKFYYLIIDTSMPGFQGFQAACSITFLPVCQRQFLFSAAFISIRSFLSNKIGQNPVMRFCSLSQSSSTFIIYNLKLCLLPASSYMDKKPLYWLLIIEPVQIF